MGDAILTKKFGKTGVSLAIIYKLPQKNHQENLLILFLLHHFAEEVDFIGEFFEDELFAKVLAEQVADRGSESGTAGDDYESVEHAE
jgi:hypothetical protein